MRCLINHIQQEDRFLFRAADKSLKTLVSTVEGLPELLPTILPCLLSGHGVYNFDRLTKTKTVERLLAMVSANNVEATMNALTKPAQDVPGSVFHSRGRYIHTD